MRVHHLNCATMCPAGGLVAPLVCHCLAIETEAGVVLVDTGLGMHDLAAPRQRLGRGFLFMTGPRLIAAETARAQLAELGIAASDVRHIVITHLDPDHAGGLADFPEAAVHIGAGELAAALSPPTRSERQRYRATQWSHGPRWAPHDAGGEPWHGFDGVRALAGLPPELLLVPLYGHTRGHHGVAVRSADGWLLHAGDAYYYQGELAPVPRCPPHLRLTQWIFETDRQARLGNQARLRALAADPAASVQIFCAHDRHELGRYQATPAR